MFSYWHRPENANETSLLHCAYQESKTFSNDNINSWYKSIVFLSEKIGCGKTEFVLDLLEGEYSGVFKYIVILCPTIQWNKAYKNREWIGDVRKPKTKNLIIVNPIVEVREANGSLYEEEKLQELLRMFFKKYAGHPTLYIIDDCSATKKN
ncbi:unnamed protein product [Mytilus coruscus]|uniref:Uncharacterized protein n=1 Tax=Mytilus coruscus TaxID=42192 RepID=A0A6J8DY03_MYTCO|nr:unnamed protein product [Mytilus coruscus]